MDMDDQNVDSNEGGPYSLSFSNFVALPAELLVYIISFLKNARDIVKLRYVSRRLRSVSETPSLWREFIWPHMDINEERCVKSVLKSCGQYIKRLSFPDHVAPSKLTVMLQHCSNLVELSIPKTILKLDQLIKLIDSMGNLRSLDIPRVRNPFHMVLPYCSRLKELTIRILTQQDNVVPHYYETLLTEWARNMFVPQVLNIVSTWEVPQYEQQRLRQVWLKLNPSAPIDQVACFKVFSSLKVPMGLHPALPDFQLQFGQSCTLPFLKASKYGLLGLQEDYLLLTNLSGNEMFHKAVMVLRSSQNIGHFCSGVANLNFVTHFNASYCQLHSGHLEQLAMACPNLLELNLQKNCNCLKSLQGLHMIADHCKNLRGLNLLDISVLEVESCVQLWKILVDMRLTYLAIEVCVLIPRKRYKHIKVTFAALYQKCFNLKALEFGYQFTCEECRLLADRQGELLLLSNFTSLVYVFASYQPNVLQDITSGCKMLKYLNYSGNSFDCPSSLVVSSKLEQLCLLSNFTEIPNTFMNSISAHGGLMYVFLCTFRITGDGIHTLIQNSPKLLTCQIYAHEFHGSPTLPLINLRDFKMALKKSFPRRKLFTCGNYRLVRQRFIESPDYSDTDLTSLWSQSLNFRY